MDNWLLIIHVLGAIQGVFLAAILLGKRRTSVPNIILAVTMVAFSLDLGMAAYHGFEYHLAEPNLIGLDYPLAFLYGPLLFLYAKTRTNRNDSFHWRYLWHFLPFAIVVLCLIPFYAQDGSSKLEILDHATETKWTLILGFVNHTKLIYAFIYVAGTLFVLRRYRRQIRNTHSSIEKINLFWLRNLMVGIIVVMAVTTVLYLLTLGASGPVMGLDASSVYDDYTLLTLAIFVYAIGFMGLRSPEIFDNRWQDVETAGSLTQAEPGRKPRYAKSGTDPEKISEYKHNLLKLMDTRKLYQRGDLTLNELARALAISPHNLTEVISTQLGQNFYDFVNGYRVREVMQRLQDPDNEHLTLLAIAMDSGFNSKSSFNAVFKKHTGMTPSQYKACEGDQGRDV